MNLENELHCFCDLESLGISGQENYVKDFSDIIYQNEDLRYEAKLPFKEHHPLLHDHFSLFEKRLQKLQSFLKNETVLLKKYNDAFVEQKELGLIEPASEIAFPGIYHYIQHHPVNREDKNAKYSPE